MYAQIEKSKENSFPTNRQESRAVVNAVAQKSSNVKQGFGFVDNRPEAVTQRKLLKMVDSCKTAMQLARGEQKDGNWKTFSSFSSGKEITTEEWVATCYLSRGTPAHRMLALEGHNGTKGWECSAHLKIPEMANDCCNPLKMGLNACRMYSMKCGPEWRDDFKENMPHNHNSIEILKKDGEELKSEMETECKKGTECYDYKTTGGDGSQSFNCKTWVDYMKPGLAI